MTWDHRAACRTFRYPDGKKEKQWGIREVYYRKNGRPFLYTKDFMEPHGETLEELREELVLMLRATYRQVFKESDVKKGASKKRA